MTAAVTAGMVLAQLRSHDFAVLSTAGADGPHAAGVTYAVSSEGDPLALYVMSRRHLQKVRDVARDPAVALVVPLARRLLWPVPPATIQLRGRAEILGPDDAMGVRLFARSWLGRRILASYGEMRRRGEGRVCFLRIVPAPVVRTYMVGAPIWRVARRMGAGTGRVVLPESLYSGEAIPSQLANA